MQSGKLERLIRPSGFYRQKAKRLKLALSYVVKNYETLEKFFGKDKAELRKELLDLNGIGNETADSIILYAAEKPTFVIDAYTRRIMHRVYGTDEEIEYLRLQKHITDRIPEGLDFTRTSTRNSSDLRKAIAEKTFVRRLPSGKKLQATNNIIVF